MASSSSTTTTGGSRIRYLRLEEGPEECDCGVREVLWTSRTNLNPGRKFYGCRFYSPPKDGERKKGCDHFVWFEPDMSRREKKELNALKMEKEALEKENKELLRRCKAVSIGDCLDQIEELKEDIKELKNLMIQLKRSRVSLVVIWLLFALLCFATLT